MRIAPANLLELLSPYRGYLADRGFSLPQQVSEEWNQRELAVLLLADDEEMPPTLVEALHVIGNTGLPSESMTCCIWRLYTMLTLTQPTSRRSTLPWGSG